MKRILVVEDNPKYAAAASYFLVGNGLKIAIAADYEQAMEALPAYAKTGAAMIDCFFPKRAGSGDITLGKEAIKRMAASDSAELEAQTVLKELSKYTDVKDPELVSLVRAYYGRSQFGGGPTLRSIKSVSDLGLGVKATTDIVKNTLRIAGGGHSSPDYFAALEKAVQDSENNQALGILVADEAERLGVSFVLATSTYHHDVLTQPIQNYCHMRSWTLIDCGPYKQDDKATQEYWDYVFRTLSAKAECLKR